MPPPKAISDILFTACAFSSKAKGCPVAIATTRNPIGEKIYTVLSKEEVWAMLHHCSLLKHKILVGLLYGCELRRMKARSVRLADLDFNRAQLKAVQGKD